MKICTILIALTLICMFMLNCDETGEKVAGSIDHNIKSVRSSNPEILADGVSTTYIFGVVYDKDGAPANGMKVIFHTSAGSIEEFDYSDWKGEVIAILTSAASRTDLIADITATVVDTSFQSMATATPSPYLVELRVPGYVNDCQVNRDRKNLNKTLDNSATIQVKFIGLTLTAEITDMVLPADGISRTTVTARLRETTSQKGIESAEIRAGTKHGTISGRSYTNTMGISEILLLAAETATTDTVMIEYGNKLITSLIVNYVTPKFELLASVKGVPADGSSRIQIIATLLSAQKNNPIVGAKVRFSASAGIIKESSQTNEFGQAMVDLIAATTPNSNVRIVASFLELRDTVTVAFNATLNNYPASIILTADPNFIWVKETGNLEQTTVTATVLSATGDPVGDDIGVTFHVINGPGGGETIVPSTGSDLDTPVIPTVCGRAEAYIRSGFRSGAVQIRAQLADYPQIVSQTTNIVIRSGPPYMWVDPTNYNNVIPHAMLIIECGKHNVAFGNPVQDIKVSAIFGDKYNNPIEKGTAVYFTTSGGIITSDAVTNEKGQTTVVLQNTFPFPDLTTEDKNQLTSCCVPNPNDTTIDLNMDIPDFEGGIIMNSMNSTIENDGIAVLLAYTWGEDQNGKRIKVWTAGLEVFSVGVYVFEVWSDKRILRLGEATSINIRLFDANGNPVAAGSKLTASTTDGKLSESELMPGADDYGFGTTYFKTSLLNDLDPKEDKETDAVVTIALDSPNGSMKQSVVIHLLLTP